MDRMIYRRPIDRHQSKRRVKVLWAFFHYPSVHGWGSSAMATREVAKAIGDNVGKAAMALVTMEPSSMEFKMVETRDGGRQ